MDTLTPEIQHSVSSDLSDDEVISRYLKNGEDRLFRVLVDRHHGRLFARFLSESRNHADATDLEQQLWLKVFRNIGNYTQEGKFAEYLSRISSNLLTDYWRSKGRRSDVFVESRSYSDSESVANDELQRSDAVNNEVEGARQDTALYNEELVQYLVSVLIPQLPVEQRMAWLLRHESEYWEPSQRLEWRHLAELNGIDENSAWSLFEGARNKLMSLARKSDANKSTESPDHDETLIFTVWSQAQRLRKEQQFTWDYFADLLDVPTNTMKTRYRAAQKFLSDGLKAQMCT